MKFDCCGTEDEEKRDGGGGDLKVGLTQRPPARAGVLNRAEQLAGHRAWNSSAWLRAAVTCCHFKQRVCVCVCLLWGWDGGWGVGMQRREKVGFC